MIGHSSCSLDLLPPLKRDDPLSMVMGMGKMMVELCSQAILLSVWRYLSWNMDCINLLSQITIQRNVNFKEVSVVLSLVHS